MPRITVAVSTFRESYFGWVMQLLTSLENQTFKEFKVLLVVNSNQRYFNKLQSSISDRKNPFFEINIIFNPKEMGIAHARNIALKNATTSYIAFTDDDAIPQDNWLKMMFETFEKNKGAGAVTGPIVANWASEIEDVASWFPKELYWIIGCTINEFPNGKEVRNGFASNLALNREFALKCGGFNESFGFKRMHRMVGEEPELCIRLKQQGKLTLWNPKVIVYHRITGSRLKISKLLIRSYIEGRTKAYLKKMFGSESTTIETQHMKTVVKAFLKPGSFQSKLYLASTSSAVAAGFFITNANITMKCNSQIAYTKSN